MLPQVLRILFVEEKCAPARRDDCMFVLSFCCRYWALRFQMLSLQLICMPPLLLSIIAVVMTKRLDTSLYAKLYLSKLKTVVEQVKRAL